jgi:hypothetical protein
MSLARYLANLLNSSGQVDLTTKVVNQLPNANIAAIAASKLTGQVPDANAPSGSVIQVVSTVVTSTASVSGTSFQDIGLSASITPSSSSSKILVLTSITLGGTTNAYIAVNLVRGSTNIVVGDTGSPGIECTFGVTDAGGSNTFLTYGALPYSFTYLDSPATTSATTYKIQLRPQVSGGYTAYMNRSNSLGDDNQFRTASTITLMEIAA